MIGSSVLTSAILLTITSLTAAQTSSKCDPTKGTCSPNAGLAQSSFSTDFTSDHSHWNALAGTPVTYDGTNGAKFVISKDGDSPTIETDFYIFFGKVDVVMQAAAGVGVVSSIVLESDDLDEIDWEFVGGDTANVQSNFFGKGDTTVYNRGTTIPVSSPQTTFHTYSVEYTSSAITWSIDGNVVRTVPYASPLANGGQNFPQTPMKLRLGSWAAGGSGSPPGTVQWAGGKTDFSQAPFNMYVKKVSITNYNPAASYSYSGTTGSYDSIKQSGAVAGSSPASSVAAPPSATPAVIISTAVQPNKQATTALASPPTSILTLSTVIKPTTSAAVVPGPSSRVSAPLPSGSGFATSQRPSSTSSSPSNTAGITLSTGGASSLSFSITGSVAGLALVFFMF